MKKILTLAVIAVASVFGANAEGLYIGGQLGFMHESAGAKAYGYDAKFDHNTFTIVPEIGYNFNDSWAVGGTIGYTYKHWCGSKTSFNMFEISPYARWSYFRTSNNLVQLFVDGGFGIGAGAYDVDVDGYKSHTGVIWNVGFRPGIAINPTPNFSIVAHVGLLGYEGANHTAQDAGYQSRGGLMLDSNDLTLGFYYNF